MPSVFEERWEEKRKKKGAKINLNDYCEINLQVQTGS